MIQILSNSPRSFSRCLASVALLVVVSMVDGCKGQRADADFVPVVARPAFTTGHPKILFDEAHNNLHTADGGYRPFVDLVTLDGYAVLPNSSPFSKQSLDGFNILIISNARGKERKYDPAFPEQECDAVQEWVRNGGNLLLIADHYPLGSAAENLAKRFGVDMSRGFTNDSVHFDSSSFTQSPVSGKSQLVFSRTNGLLGQHPVLEGRDSSERINRVITFTGQSLKGPTGSGSLLNLSPSSYDVIPDSIWEKKEWVFFTSTVTRFADPVPAAGRSQCVTLEFGKGRVVVLGEAAMLTAQVFENEHFGMNVKGTDNRQLALNIMHWLSRLI